MFSLINGTGLLIGIGSATLFSIATGKGERGAGSRIFTQSFLLGAVLGVILTLCGIFLNQPIAMMLGANGDHIISMTSTYLKLLMVFSCAFILNNLLVAFVRNEAIPASRCSACLAAASLILCSTIFLSSPCSSAFRRGPRDRGLSHPQHGNPVLAFLPQKNHFRLKRPA